MPTAATQVPISAFESGVLKDRHETHALCARIDHYAERAGIDPRWIWTTALDMSPVEIDYMRKCRILYRETGYVGMYYSGSFNVAERMARMAGALVRAFIDARVASCAKLLSYIEDREEFEAKILLIPDFYIVAAYARVGVRNHHAAMQVAGLVRDRATRGQQTVLYIEDPEKAEKLLGGAFMEIVHSRMGEIEASSLK